jgi:hypothetical protein
MSYYSEYDVPDGMIARPYRRLLPAGYQWTNRNMDAWLAEGVRTQEDGAMMGLPPVTRGRGNREVGPGHRYVFEEFTPFSYGEPADEYLRIARQNPRLWAQTFGSRCEDNAYGPTGHYHPNSDYFVTGRIYDWLYTPEQFCRRRGW